MKIIAFYLPQFHEIPENNKWYGKGFTEWDNLKSMKPLYAGHNQPRVPYGKNYYSLDEADTLRWQASLAREYGVYGFCFYHYWFEGRMIMEKPISILLENKDIDISYCMCWANHNWTKSMREKSKEIILKQTYGNEEEWEKHFLYFLPFFKDKRYIKIGGRPLLVIYRPEHIGKMTEMAALWRKLAKENGLKGLCLAYQYPNYDHRKAKSGFVFDYGVEYQPALIRKAPMRKVELYVKGGANLIARRLGIPMGKFTTLRLDYKKTWNSILRMKPRDEKMIPGAFVDWDNTPRRKEKGSFYFNVSPDTFRKYLSKQIKRAKEIYHKDIMFLFAWNEWGEGGYLEPDEKYGNGMLEAIRDALNENKEFPH